MKQTLTALLVVLLFATIVVLAVEKAAEKSNADILIARIKADYAKALKKADEAYVKNTAKWRITRDKRILGEVKKAIGRLNTARKGVSEIDGINMEKEIEKIRVSSNAQIGKEPIITPKISVLKACGVSFKGHTYLAITSNANWKEAAALCKKMGGHLVYIETAEESAFLTKTFREARLWVGATDAHKEGYWRWGNGKPIAKNLWHYLEPDNWQGKQDCAVLVSSKGLRLMCDMSFNHTSVIGFICEWE